MIGKLLRGGFLAVLNLASGISLSASPGSFSPATYDGELEHGRYVGALQLQGEVFHVQGLALDPKHVWVTSAHRPKGGSYTLKMRSKNFRFSTIEFLGFFS